MKTFSNQVEQALKIIVTVYCGKCGTPNDLHALISEKQVPNVLELKVNTIEVVDAFSCACDKWRTPENESI